MEKKLKLMSDESDDSPKIILIENINDKSDEYGDVYIKENYRDQEELSLFTCISYTLTFCAYFLTISYLCERYILIKHVSIDLLTFNIIVCGVMGAVISIFKVIAIYWWSLRDNTKPSKSLRMLTKFISVYFMLYAIYCSLVLIHFLTLYVYDSYKSSKANVSSPSVKVESLIDYINN